MNSCWSPAVGGSIKTATRFEMPLCTRSAASSAPAPPESSDKTMISADATDSFTTSAHPAARRTGSRRERIVAIANATNASTTRIGTHLGNLKIILGFTGLLHESAMSPACWHVRDGTRVATRDAAIRGRGRITYSHILGRQVLPPIPYRRSPAVTRERACNRCDAPATPGAIRGADPAPVSGVPRGASCSCSRANARSRFVKSILESRLVEEPQFQTPGRMSGRLDVCHERRMSYLGRVTVREMKEGPSSSVIRSRSQATASCCGQNPWW